MRPPRLSYLSQVFAGVVRYLPHPHRLRPSVKDCKQFARFFVVKLLRFSIELRDSLLPLQFFATSGLGHSLNLKVVAGDGNPGTVKYIARESV